MTAAQATAESAERLKLAAEREARLFSAPDEALTKPPKPGEWSRLQHADHLVRVHRLYTRGMADRLATLPTATGAEPYRQGRYVSFLLAAMAPGKRMATGGPFSPLRHPAPGIVEELAETRREILQWVELAEGRDLNLRVCRSPAPLVRMGFAEWLTLHARHAEYHADVMELFDPFCAG